MTNVADIVIATPAAARVFERHAIDYCCHGQRPLDQACTESGADLAAVQAELDALGVSPTSEPIANEVGALVGHIVSVHHTYLRRELPRLRELMVKVLAAHGAAHPEVHDVAATLEALTNDLLPHLQKEEKVLFPLAIELLGAVEPAAVHCGSVINPIHVMHAEHDRVGELLATLRQQTGSYQAPADACPTWRALYAGCAEMEAAIAKHVHLENNVLFPRIIGLEAALV